ncbi:MAG TPA: SpoIVB peptidase S55 domain-containing protein [Vicinamibacteria bacterium]|nr:SpoIVB peptidase S55 domain-containing protein [Vicinamibacteria bacterium]
MIPRSLLLVLSLLPCLCARALAGDAVMPLSEVRPGMEGSGRTVFEGARVDEFKVHILGVLENALGPRQSLILARLEGGPLANTGVIAGMSGSPVFVDGKLVGAIAYAFPFGKEPIAGVTPIGDMIDATSTRAPRAASARFHATAADGALAAPLDREQILAALRRPLQEAVAGPGATLRPLALPLVFSGFSAAAFDWARGVFSAMGFVPVLGGGGGSASVGPLPKVAPGAAVGISLIEGDLDLSVTGTITHIDGDRIYAFGHPFYNLGPTQFPMRKAWVYSLFPSLQVSWKIAAAMDPVGTMDQDRSTAVAGHLGAAPRMIPVEVTLRSPRSEERVFHYRMVDDELFTPLLTYVSLLSVIQGYERAFGAATLRVDARVALSGGREVRIQDVLADEQPGSHAAAALASPLALLVGNDFQKVEIDRLQVSVDADETVRTAAIVRAWVDAPLPLRPGASAPVKVQLRTHRGDVLTETLPLSIPEGAPAGTYSLLVADAATMDGVEQRETRRRFAPRDFPQLVKALNELRSDSTVYARLTRPGAGAVVGGEYLPALPGSVLSVLGSADQGTSVVSLANAPMWSYKQPTDYAVSGSRQITIAVQR